VVTTKITVFWDVTLCNLVDRYWCFRGICYLSLQGRKVCPEDGGSTGLPKYMASHPRRQYLQVAYISKHSWGALTHRLQLEVQVMSHLLLTSLFHCHWTRKSGPNEKFIYIHVLWFVWTLDILLLATLKTAILVPLEDDLGSYDDSKTFTIIS
jgi:hypothetical protein